MSFMFFLKSMLVCFITQTLVAESLIVTIDFNTHDKYVLGTTWSQKGECRSFICRYDIKKKKKIVEKIFAPYATTAHYYQVVSLMSAAHKVKLQGIKCSQWLQKEDGSLKRITFDNYQSLLNKYRMQGL